MFNEQLVQLIKKKTNPAAANSSFRNATEAESISRIGK